MKLLFLVFVGTLTCFNCMSQTEMTTQELLNAEAKAKEERFINDKRIKEINDANDLSKYNNHNKNFVSVSTFGFPILEIDPTVSFKEQINLQEIRQIKLFDVRSDISKVGFLPVNLNLKKKGIKTIGFQIKDGPLKWLTKSFIDAHIITDSTCKRDLIVVLQKCWFSTNANELYSASNPKLKTSLEYEFDIYTLFNDLYFPQKKINGAFTELYNEGKGLNTLIDSLLQVLKLEVFIKNYAEKENLKNAISLYNFNDFYNQQLKRYKEISISKKGVYLTYEDFLNKKIFADTVELVNKYDNIGRTNIYATEITAIKNGASVSCNKAWGYFDGVSLFVNNSNGLYIKLTHLDNSNYIFSDLNNFASDRIKSPIKSSLIFGKSNYEIIKDYSRVTPLTYQLDLATGKLN